MPSFDGTSGNDVLNGTDEADLIRGLEGDDTIHAGAGDDTIEGGDGADIINAGDGNDSIYINDLGEVAAGEQINGGAGNDTLVAVGYFELPDDSYYDISAATLTGIEVLESNGMVRIGLTGDQLAGITSLAADLYFTTGGAVSLDGITALRSVGFRLNPAGNQLDLRGFTPDGFSIVRGGIGDDTVQGSASSDDVYGDDGNDRLYGNGGSDYLTGNAGNDTLDGGAGTDTLNGDAGDDTYIVDSTQDVASEEGGDGFDIVLASASFTLAAGLENLTLTGNSARFGTGNASANVISGNDVDNILDGAAGDDDVQGNGGDDLLLGGSGDDSLDGGAGLDRASYANAAGGVTVSLAIAGAQNTGSAGTDILTSIEGLVGSSFGDELTGDDAANRLSGLAGDDLLIGGLGDDELTGGGGTDRMYGGVGNDSYIVVDATDHAYEQAGEGIDEVFASVTHQLRDNIENLSLTGVENIDGTGNALNNSITGNGGANAISGGGGTDTFAGGAGDDRYFVEAVVTSVDGGGYAFSAIDQVIEAAGAGIDTVVSNASYTLGANVENLELSGTLDLSGFGNALDNVISGNGGANFIQGGDGNDWLDGGAGADMIEGGAGNDTYVIDNAGDSLGIESPIVESGGIDTIRSSLSHMLGMGFENLTLTGTAAIDGIGNSFANRIIGNSGSNSLSGGGGDDVLQGDAGDDSIQGGAGLDKMYGGAGDDSYTVVDSTDYVYENSGEGTDRVFAAVSHALRDNVEELTLTGTANLYGRGNDGANTVTGNIGRNDLIGYGGDDRLYGEAGNDELDGGAGVDRLYGGLGNDVYVVSDATDYIYENLGEGYDVVYSSVDVALRANIERLNLTGSGNIDGRGNDESNTISGNVGANTILGQGGNDYLYGQGGDDRVEGATGNDRLDGGAGLDRLIGGDGDDIYIVRDATDYIYENAGAGYDRVYSAVDVVLRANLERLYLTGSDDISGRGNDEANIISGNSGANTILGQGGDDFLYGVAGNDTVHGGLGNDRTYGGDGEDILHGDDGDDQLEGGAGRDDFYGGTGADLFVFRQGDFAASMADRIVDFSQAEGDVIHLNLTDADSTLDGDQDFAFIGANAFTGSAGELAYYQTGGHTYVVGDTDGDGAADFMLRVDGLHTLAAEDFIL